MLTIRWAMLSRALRRSCLLLTLAAATAQAQPAAEPKPAEPAPEAPLEPKLPEIDDPMLKPVPSAKNVLRSWQEALRLARSQSSELALSAAQMDLADGQERQALSRALPTLTGTGSVTRHLLMGDGFSFGSAGLTRGTIPDPNTTWNAGLALRVPVFAPQAWYDHGTAKRNKGAARLSHSDRQRLVLAQTASAIVSVVTAERVAEISRVSLKGSLSTLDLNQRRAKLGAASAVDVLRAEQEVTLTRSQVVQADEGVLRAREALGIALGSSDPYGVVPAIRVDALASDARSVCRPVSDPDTRADVRAARARLEVAERNVKSTDYSFVPTVDFVSNLGWTSNDRATANQEHVTWTIGGLLTWQLYDGGLRYGTRTANQAQRRIAEEQVTQSKRLARVEGQQAQRAVEVAKQNLAVAGKSRQLATESARLARIAFVSGHGNSFDLIDADRRLRSAELDLAVKEFELIRAQIAALLALSTCDV
ncbi:MAG: TolC family protein [Sorangiineae bacterium PRO1]|nr:TolC family protein [Sorangiineae bacterium PRO1]